MSPSAANSRPRLAALCLAACLCSGLTPGCAGKPSGGPGETDPTQATTTSETGPDATAASAEVRPPTWVIAERDPAETGRYPLGSPDNPVRAHEPAGQQAYLSRLRNLQGNAPTYRRIGPHGIGPHGYILDAYELTDPDSGAQQTVYLDMYHPGHREDRPIAGYQIAPPARTAQPDTP
ncbi:MAG: hypothetical protein AAF288_12610 [Planctomycetota bacterium]